VNTHPGAIVELDDGKRFRVTERKVELLADQRYRVTVVYVQVGAPFPAMKVTPRPQMTNAVAGPTTATPRGVRS
jgi:hypothetical protein